MPSLSLRHALAVMVFWAVPSVAAQRTVPSPVGPTARRPSTRSTAQRAPVARAPVARTAAATAVPAGNQSVVRTFSRLGYPNGMSLDGGNAQQILSLRLPSRANIDGVHIHLRLHFSKLVTRESSVRVVANAVRIADVLRANADTSGSYDVDADVPGSLLGAGYLSLTISSALTTNPDRCLDRQSPLAYVQIDSSSSIAYSYPISSIQTIGQVWSALPETVTVALPGRRLTADEFRAAYMLGIDAENDGRTIAYATLPALGDISIGTPQEIAGADSLLAAPTAGSSISVVHFTRGGSEHAGIAISASHVSVSAGFLAPQWATLTSASALDVRSITPVARALPDNPTFADLGIMDLERDLGAAAVWRIPIDLRTLPAGRVPSRIALRVVAAPNTHDRQLTLFAFLNGTLVQSADLNDAGTPQLVTIRLPSDQVITRNELRVVIQRHNNATAPCAPSDEAMPTQLLPNSTVITAKASASVHDFTAVTARLGAGDPVYLPDDALESPRTYLPLLVPLGRAFWFSDRAPTPTFYGVESAATPAGAFIVIGRPAGVTLDGPVAVDSGHFVVHRRSPPATILDIKDLGAWSVAQVVEWGGHVGIQILPSRQRARIPDWPEAYGASNLVLADPDSALFQLKPDPEGGLLFNDGPTLMDRVRSDWILWSIFAAILIIPPLLFGLYSVIRRTPRRDVRRPTVPTRPGTRG